MSDADAILTITDKARAKILEIRAQEPDADDLALSVEVSGVVGGSYSYELTFLPLSDVGPDDVVIGHDDLSVVVPRSSVEKLRGATLDMSRDLLSGGLVIDNPNRPSPAILDPDAPRPELTGDVAERVSQILDVQINPSIAAHGGHAELVAVEDDTAYLRLSGGCQGCGMATVTLKHGIEVAIKQAVPEIEQVVDVTDHASGDNPYFEAAKK
jgi:Fe/S biogenesis protein NfuA